MQRYYASVPAANFFLVYNVGNSRAIVNSNFYDYESDLLSLAGIISGLNHRRHRVC